MRLLISGSRYYSNLPEIEKEIDKIVLQLGKPQEVTLIHGACPTGVDSVIDSIAQKKGWKSQVFPADWRQGLRAGPLRNQEMVDSRPDWALLFLSPESRGTKDTLTRVQRARIAHTVIELPRQVPSFPPYLPKK